METQDRTPREVAEGRAIGLALGLLVLALSLPHYPGHEFVAALGIGVAGGGAIGLGGVAWSATTKRRTLTTWVQDDVGRLPKARRLAYRVALLLLSLAVVVTLALAADGGRPPLYWWAIVVAAVALFLAVRRTGRSSTK